MTTVRLLLALLSLVAAFSLGMGWQASHAQDSGPEFLLDGLPAATCTYKGHDGLWHPLTADALRGQP